MGLLAARGKAWAALLLLTLGLVVAVPQTYSAFTSTSDNGGTLSTASYFPTYPEYVTAGGASQYHRLDDAASFAAPTTAADASDGDDPGVFTGATDGPSAHYRFDDGTGTTAADSAGTGNTGTATGAVTWSDGHVGAGGITVSGTNYVASAAPAVDTSTSFSVSAWAYLTDNTANRTIASQDGVNASAFFLKFEPSSNRWQFVMYDADSNSGSGGKIVTSPAAPTLNRWTHLAAVYSDAADSLSLYVDGALVDTATKTLDWASAGSLIVGAGRWGANTRANFFKGSIDDVRTYRRVLTSGDVSQLYGSPTTSWTLDAASTPVLDASGNTNTGTPAGTGTSVAATGVTLDGVTGHLTGTRPGMHTDRNFSVAAWVYPSTVAGTGAVISQPGVTASAFTLARAGAAYTFSMTSADLGAPSTTTVTSQTPASTSAGAYLVAVYSADASELRLYVNGVLEATGIHSTAWDATGALTVGRALTGGSYDGHLAGRVQAVRAFPRVLTSDDAFDLYTDPLARYDFDDNRTTTALDKSGNGHTATKAAGTTTWLSSSHRGGALSFNGTAYLTTPSAVVDTSTSYSISAWVYLPSASIGAAGARTVVSQDATNTSPFMLQHTNVDGTNKWEFQVYGADDPATSQIVLSSGAAIGNRWTHLVATYDDPADAITLYVNGTVAGTGSATADFASTGPLVVGANLWSTSRGTYWPGTLDDIAVYQRVLKPTDVSTLFGISPRIRYDLNENAGTNAADRSGGNTSGTLTNGATWTTGRNGSAVHLDGVDDHVASPNNSPIATDNSFSVSAWVKLTTTGPAQTAVSQNGAAVSAYSLGYDGTRWSFQSRTADSTSLGTLDTAVSTSTPAAATWTHLTGVYDDAANQLKLYVNGSLEGTAAKSTDWNTAGAFVLGHSRWTGVPDAFWSGAVDEVYAYGRALRDTDVHALAGFYQNEPHAVTGHLPAMTAGVPGALHGAQQGQAGSTAVAFNGTGHLYNPLSHADPQTFTVELWFKASGPAGGTLVGFTTSTTSMATTADRLVYLDSGGKLTFGAAPGGTRGTVRSPGAYNDGAWHHMAASLGPAGMKLYADGKLVAGNAAATSAESATGNWRWGGINLDAWPHRPPADRFVGSLDELAIYPTQLTDNDISRHHASNF